MMYAICNNATGLFDEEVHELNADAEFGGWAM
jgi:hypothetical protein